MKTTLLALLLLITSSLCFSQTSQSSVYKLINQMSKDQQVVLQEALDSRNKAEAERVLASGSLTLARVEIDSLKLDVEKLNAFSEQWQKRSDWFQEQNVILDQKRLEALEKYSTISWRVNWVATGIAILLGVFTYAIVISRFAFGIFNMSAQTAALVSAGAVGLFIFTAIQLFFRVS